MYHTLFFLFQRNRETQHTAEQVVWVFVGEVTARWCLLLLLHFAALSVLVVIIISNNNNNKKSVGSVQGQQTLFLRYSILG